MGQRNQPQPQAQLERDAAIARIGRARRWLIVAATALTAGFAAIISAVAPGRSFAAHSATSASGAARPLATSARTSSSRASTKLPPLQGAQALGLGGPAQAPQASSAADSGSTSQSQVAPSQSQVAPSQSQVSPAQTQAPAPAQTQAPAPAQSSPPVVSGGS